MKKLLINIFKRPGITISMVAVLTLIVGIPLYKKVGQAPIVPVFDNIANDSPVVLGNNLVLSFPNSGRVEAVLVKSGDIVNTGDILARLSAPDQLGAVSQAKGALDLVKAQYASLNTQYDVAKKQQDTLVENAYKILLSTDLQGISDDQDSNVPVISGTYTCDKEGSYILNSYVSSDIDSGFSLRYSGLESGTIPVKYENSIPLGNCGLQIRFVHNSSFNASTLWTVNIPNVNSDSYLSNKNAYDLAVTTRDKTLSDITTTVGDSVAKARIEAAAGAYQAALGAYQNNLIVSPVAGVVNFIDKDLKVGQSVSINKAVIGISIN